MCRVFKKSIQIPKSKEEESNGGIINNNGDEEREVEDENLNTSSSDFTQGTPTELTVNNGDDFQPPFDEANSASHIYSLGVDFSSNLIQVH